MQVRILTPAEAREHIPALAAVLLDCVEGGASVSFMLPFTQADAELFFAGVAASAERQERLLLAAFDGFRLIGTVQLIPANAPNQPHRADIVKLLVHRAGRGQGVATHLMHHAEAAARATHKTLLVLDTVTGGVAEGLYLRLGWTKAGIIPNYAMFPDGRFCDTTVFWKQLA